MKGEKTDGHNFIASAMKKGAAAVVFENNPVAKNSVILIKVSDSRKALAYISNNFYQMPSEQLSLIGITGTNARQRQHI